MGGGMGMFMLGCLFTFTAGWSLLYIKLSSDIKQLTTMNNLMEAQLIRLDIKIPTTEEDNSASDMLDLETWIFLSAIGILVFLGMRFSLREYALLKRTRIGMEEAQLEAETDATAHKGSMQRLAKHFIMYRLDYYFSASAYSKPLTLFVLTLGLIIAGGFARTMVRTESIGSAMWHSWGFIADSGAHADETETGPRIVGLLCTIGGMLVFALVIGLISDAISEKFDSLKRGKAKVIETDHTLILGWSDKTLPLIREIAVANESLVKEGKTCVIAVLAEVDKEMMESEIRESRILELGSMVVCRTGNPTVLHDLQHVSAKTARSVIVLSSVGMSADEADAKSLRVVLCLVGLQYTRGHITVEVADVDNKELVHIIGKDSVETVVAHDFIGRLIVQSSRQPGLAPILERVLGFEGCEFYMEEWSILVGLKFSEALFHFNDAVPVGIAYHDPLDLNKKITKLNPPDDFIIKEGMEIIVLAEDDDSYTPSDKLLAQYPPARSPRKKNKIHLQNRIVPKKKKEKVLFIGWRRDLGDMLHELDEVVAEGSELFIFSTVPLNQREEKLSANGRDAHLSLKNLTLVHVCGNPVVRRSIEKLDVNTFDSVFILADEEFESDMEAADGRSLTSLLLIRDIRKRRRQELLLEQAQMSPRGKKKKNKNGGGKDKDKDNNGVATPQTPLSATGTPRVVFETDGDTDVSVVSEVMDPRTRSLISLAKVSDYVMSNEMVSAALAMVAECRDVNAILKELLSSDGNEIYVRAIEDYIPVPQTLSYWDLMSEVRTHQSILLGYRIQEEEPQLNPENKSEAINWQKGDKVVLLAED